MTALFIGEFNYVPHAGIVYSFFLQVGIYQLSRSLDEILPDWQSLPGCSVCLPFPETSYPEKGATGLNNQPTPIQCPVNRGPTQIQAQAHLQQPTSALENCVRTWGLPSTHQRASVCLGKKMTCAPGL